MNTVMTSLNFKPDCTVLRLPLNRPNIVYLVRRITTISRPWEDLSFLVPLNDDPLSRKADKVMIFCQSMRNTLMCRKYLESRLAPHARDKGIVLGFHSGMSECYLQETLKSFSDIEGNCKFFVATVKASVVSIPFQIYKSNIKSMKGSRYSKCQACHSTRLYRYNRRSGPKVWTSLPSTGSERNGNIIC